MKLKTTQMEQRRLLKQQREPEREKKKSLMKLARCENEFSSPYPFAAKNGLTAGFHHPHTALYSGVAHTVKNGRKITFGVFPL